MKLKSVQIKGYKSIGNRDYPPLKFGNITVFLGANGVGKSNLVSFFSMLNHMMTGSLQTFVAERGYANSFLHYGAKITREIEASLVFEDENSTDIYQFRLTHAAGDILIFTEEKLIRHQKEQEKAVEIVFEPAVKEANILQFVTNPTKKDKDKQTSNVILKLVGNCKVFHFHDTSATSQIRLQSNIQDNRYLKSNAGNLAAFLFRLKNDAKTYPYYQKIVRYIQKAMPQFGDFDLAPNELNRNYISLNWREKSNQDYLFGSHQISDGSLRFMCLATLLLQPKHLLPNVIILDEPELGLHPSSLAYLGGMIKAVSKDSQIVIATQSQRLVDEFDLQNIVVVERDHLTNSTIFDYKNEETFAQWLENYSLSELWEKNVIGGQP